MSQGTQVSEIQWGGSRLGPPLHPEFLARREKQGVSSFQRPEPQGASFPYKCLSAFEARRCLGTSFRFSAKALPGFRGSGGVRGKAIQTFRVFSYEVILNRVKRGETSCHS
jgi:hypothetical protein